MALQDNEDFCSINKLHYVIDKYRDIYQYLHCI